MARKAVVREVERTEALKADARNPPAHTGEMSIPVIEEHLNIGKKIVEKGTFQIRKTVGLEDYSEEVPTVHEKVNIQRLEINKYVDSMPEVRHEDNTTIIPVIKEVVVVEKKLLLVEEIHITKSREEVAVNVKDKLRKEHVEINKTK